MGCRFQDILSWYQKKIGTYDKQEWEKTVEGRILSCISHVPKKKTAKLKPELIDVDLVRGSSFTKAKPKTGLMTVTRLGLTRLLLLPAYVTWWSAQTSPKLFILLSSLYSLQLINSILYLYLPEQYIQGVPSSEVLIPLFMMVLLSILHSHIVSPRSQPPKDLSSAPTAPQTFDDRWRSRTKRRLRHISPDKTTEPSSPECGGLLPEPTSKFCKRVRLRKSSLEDASKVTLRRRRKVAWDASPIKYNKNMQETDDSPPPLAEEMDGGSPGDDDGFESLNSAGGGQGSGGGGGGGGTGGEEGGGSDARTGGETGSVPEAVLRNNWLEHSARRANLGRNGNVSSGETDHKDSDSDNSSKRNQRLICRRRGSSQVLHVATGVASSSTPVAAALPLLPVQQPLSQAAAVAATERHYSSLNSSDDEWEGGPADEEAECVDRASSFNPPPTEGGTTSAAEWIGITTNSEECSVSSEIDEHPFASEFHSSPSAILSPSCVASDRVSCTLWEKKEVKKADLSVLDISSAIIARVESMPENMDYFYVGMVISMLVGFVPSVSRVCSVVSPEAAALSDLGNWTEPGAIRSNLIAYTEAAFGNKKWTQLIVGIALLERALLSSLFFFLVSVAERTFKQRFLYAKLFSALTSTRRARKSGLPHFRLHKARNIKTWLSVRSYLRKRGPQHSVDVIVSSVFFLTIFLLGFISLEYLKESDILSSQCTIEALVWGMILGCFLLRFMTLGTKINRKYSNLSVLITEQINLYLQIEQKPNKKEELMVANSVLKLAADLLKELECPYKISGISANPYLYTITKVVILSALSGVLSEILGFKLKLHKIKIK